MPEVVFETTRSGTPERLKVEENGIEIARLVQCSALGMEWEGEASAVVRAVRGGLDATGPPKSEHPDVEMTSPGGDDPQVAYREMDFTLPEVG